MSGLIDHYVSVLDDQVQFLSRGLIGLPLWAGLIPLASGALGAEAGVGLFVTSASVGVIFFIALFTTIGRLAKIADSQPDEIAELPFSKFTKSQPFAAFAFVIAAVVIGIIVWHGLILL